MDSLRVRDSFRAIDCVNVRVRLVLGFILHFWFEHLITSGTPVQGVNPPSTLCLRPVQHMKWNNQTDPH